MKCTNEACPYRQEPGPIECPAANNGCGGYQGDLLKDPHYIRMTHPVLIDTEEDADKLVQAMEAADAERLIAIAQNGQSAIDTNKRLVEAIETMGICIEALKALINGEWVDTDKVEKALGISFAEGMKRFEFSRTAEWWSIAGETEEERSHQGQKIKTRFRMKIGRGDDK